LSRNIRNTTEIITLFGLSNRNMIRNIGGRSATSSAAVALGVAPVAGCVAASQAQKPRHFNDVALVAHKPEAMEKRARQWPIWWLAIASMEGTEPFREPPDHAGRNICCQHGSSPLSGRTAQRPGAGRDIKNPGTWANAHDIQRGVRNRPGDPVCGRFVDGGKVVAHLRVVRSGHRVSHLIATSKSRVHN
jgi:hypothetical protein